MWASVLKKDKAIVCAEQVYEEKGRKRESEEQKKRDVLFVRVVGALNVYIIVHYEDYV